MGKVLVEKLLRSCPDIGRLYLLMRPLPGKDAAHRLQELINNQVFASLRQDRPDVFSKCVPISGDISLPELGLSLADLQMLSGNVTVVFHSAARIKFDDDLRGAIDSNVKGPQKVASLCRQLKHLEAFVHVSTVFNNLDKNEIEEEIYPAVLDPHKLMDLIDCMNDKLLESITKQLVGNCPNVYAYTKALGEQLLQKECSSHDIPLVIVRPSIVTAAMKEPLPGWIDNLNGPSGLVAGVGKGLLRALKADPQLVGDMLPVDIPINLMIAAAWNRAMNQTSKEIVVYNCSTGSLNPITWRQFNEYGLAAWEKYPTKGLMWYPSTSFSTHPLAYKTEVSLYHYLPAYLFDTAARICGQRPFLVRLYDKAHKAMQCLDFYMMRQWNFVSKNPIQLLGKMSVEDKRIFYFDVRDIHWKSYIETYILGTRRFLLKDELNTLPTARKQLQRLYWLKMIFRLLFLAGILFFFYFILQKSLNFFNYNISEVTNDIFVRFGDQTSDQIVFGHHILSPDIQ